MAAARSWSNAVLKVRALVEQGTLEEVPAWVDLVERFGVFTPKKGKSPKQIHFEEDRLYQAYMAKNPQFLQQPLDLNSEQPPAIKLFVMAQVALMEQGHNRKTAYKLVEEHFRKSAPNASLSAGQLTLSAAQKHEERILKEALKQRRDEVGPPPGLSTASQILATQSFSFRLPPRPQAAAQSQDSSAAQQAMPSTPLDQPAAQTGSSNQQAYPGQSQDQADSRSPDRRLKWQTQSGGVDDTPPNSQEGRGHGAPAGFVAFGSSDQ